MKKKMLAIAVAMLVFASTGAFALGIGLQGGFDPGLAGTGTGAVTFKLDNAPWIFAVTGTFGNQLGVGLTADVWVANKPLVGPVNYYYGWGLAGSFFFSDNTQSLGAGFRLLAGVNAFILENFLEFYLQVAWQPGVGVVIGKTGDFNTQMFSFPANLGFRLWLKA